MDVLETLEIESWNGPFSEDDAARAADSLESGRVLFFPRLPFVLRAEENALLTPALSGGRGKNISLDPSGRLKHYAARKWSACC